MSISRIAGSEEPVLAVVSGGQGTRNSGLASEKLARVPGLRLSGKRLV